MNLTPPPGAAASTTTPCGRQASVTAALPLLIGVSLCLGLCTGCADYTYDRVQLGAYQRELERLFPEARSRRTVWGFCYAEQEPINVNQAIVVLLTDDRRVAGKLQATQSEGVTLFGRETTYRLRGEMDPKLMEMGGSGPVDTIRVIVNELTRREADGLAREAHAWVGAGLVRILQQWPNVANGTAAQTKLADTLERVPAGGLAQLTVDERGLYVVGYKHRVTR